LGCWHHLYDPGADLTAALAGAVHVPEVSVQRLPIFNKLQKDSAMRQRINSRFANGLLAIAL
jgi:hypothetical protein